MQPKPWAVCRVQERAPRLVSRVAAALHQLPTTSTIREWPRATHPSAAAEPEPRSQPTVVQEIKQGGGTRRGPEYRSLAKHTAKYRYKHGNRAPGPRDRASFEPGLWLDCCGGIRSRGKRERSPRARLHARACASMHPPALICVLDAPHGGEPLATRKCWRKTDGDVTVDLAASGCRAKHRGTLIAWLIAHTSLTIAQICSSQAATPRSARSTAFAPARRCATSVGRSRRGKAPLTTPNRNVTSCSKMLCWSFLRRHAGGGGALDAGSCL